MQDVWRLVRQSPSIELASDAKTAIAECRTFLDELLDSDSSRVIYGVNTGFGDLAHTRVGASELGELQRNLLISHACGVGEDVPNAVVKAMLLLKIKALSQGHSGVRMETVERLIAHWNHRLFPVVPSQGSLGASGDLAPLSHMVLPLIGYGEVHVEGVAVPAHDVLKAKNWKPLKLEAKEGLALINGTQLMLGYGRHGHGAFRTHCRLGRCPLCLVFGSVARSCRCFRRGHSPHSKTTQRRSSCTQCPRIGCKTAVGNKCPESRSKILIRFAALLRSMEPVGILWILLERYLKMR